MMPFMPARLIVDGNNVMGSRPDGWWRDRAGAAARLVVELGDWAEEDVVVVFDGRAPERLDAPPRVDVRFAQRPGPDAADDVIAALVADDPDPASLRVVTSDARLAERVRAHGATVIGAGGFRDAISRGRP
jgi:predicted RNA-binding protein with PIN domain